MDAMQEIGSMVIVIVDLVHLMVHHGDVGTGPSVGIPRFDHESRINYRDGDELMMNNLDAGEALGDGSRTGWRRSTDADDGEEAAGGILNRLLHVLAEVTHLGGLGVWTIGQSCVRRSVS